jgi:hypothetical protein
MTTLTLMTPEQLRAARAALGLTQAEFAQAFAVSLRAICGWEQGGRNGRPGRGNHAGCAPVKTSPLLVMVYGPSRFSAPSPSKIGALSPGATLARTS